MRQYSSASTVNAAKLIAVQRSSLNPSAMYRLVYEAPEVGANAAGFVDVPSTWITAQNPAVGGYLIAEGGDAYRFIPAAAFELIYTLVP